MSRGTPPSRPSPAPPDASTRPGAAPAPARAHPRVSESLTVRYKLATQTEFIERYSANVSEGGIFIATQEKKAIGAELVFEIQLGDGTTAIKGRGVVRWCRERDAEKRTPAGIGVQFTELDPASKSVLRAMLQQRSGVAPSAGDAVPPAEGSAAGPVAGDTARPRGAGVGQKDVVPATSEESVAESATHAEASAPAARALASLTEKPAAKTTRGAAASRASEWAKRAVLVLVLLGAGAGLGWFGRELYDAQPRVTFKQQAPRAPRPTSGLPGGPPGPRGIPPEIAQRMAELGHVPGQPPMPPGMGTMPGAPHASPSGLPAAEGMAQGANRPLGPTAEGNTPSTSPAEANPVPGGGAAGASPSVLPGQPVALPATAPVPAASANAIAPGLPAAPAAAGAAPTGVPNSPPAVAAEAPQPPTAAAPPPVPAAPADLTAGTDPASVAVDGAASSGPSLTAPAKGSSTTGAVASASGVTRSRKSKTPGQTDELPPSRLPMPPPPEELLAAKIRHDLVSLKGLVQACYDRVLKDRPNASGRVVLEFTLTTGGKVADTRVVESTFRDPSILGCLRRGFDSLRFDGVHEELVVQIPYELTPAPAL